MLMSCNEHIDTPYIRSKIWSYDGGFKIGKGDFVQFDEKLKLFDLKGDTIYYDGHPRAIITRLDKGNFEMYVKSIDGTKAGKYRNTEESSE